MKLNYTQKSNRRAGMTLLELTVVILVLLSLISILFVGARAWKRGSDRSANIMNLRNCQQAMRGHQNMRGLSVGDDCDATIIFGPGGDGVGGYLREPTAPNTEIEYSPGTVVTEIGTLWLTATYATADDEGFYAPELDSYADW